MRGDDHTTRYRVSVRELRETTWRALLADGVSSGEAMVAAEAVAFTEIHLASGLDAVEAELARPRSDDPCALRAGRGYDVIEDPGDRGPLLLAPLAIGLVAATPKSSSVLMPGATWHPIIAAFLARFSRHEGVPLIAIAASNATPSEPEPGVAGAFAFPDGSFTLLGAADEEADGAKTGTGVLISRYSPQADSEPRSLTNPIGLVQAAEWQARGNGVNVDGQRWRAVKNASNQFLVPEN